MPGKLRQTCKLGLSETIETALVDNEGHGLALFNPLSDDVAIFGWVDVLTVPHGIAFFFRKFIEIRARCPDRRNACIVIKGRAVFFKGVDLALERRCCRDEVRRRAVRIERHKHLEGQDNIDDHGAEGDGCRQEGIGLLPLADDEQDRCNGNENDEPKLTA